MERNQEENIRCVEKTSNEYPKKLRNYDDMPERLYVRGRLPSPDLPSAAIVGARMCSPYGRIQAFHYAEALSQAGVQIISGLAWGIDSESHKGALEGGTPTYAVLGNGADICYPRRNSTLYHRIIRMGGGVFSEYPPGTQAKKYFFPARNRIISALSDLVLIVEAKEKSGSLITARWAIEQGKTVFALPGPVNEALSQGCHQLIYDGAGIALSPEILLQELGLNCENKINLQQKSELGLASDLNLVYSCLDLRPKSRDFISQETGMPLEKTAGVLMELEIMGLVREIGRHYYVKSRT